MENTFVHDFGKFRMVLDNDDVDVSKQVKDYGWYEDEKLDLEILARYLKPGMTFVDLGANVGFYTIFARSIVGEKGRVFSFEPFPRNAELIRASVEENKFKNVTVVQAAVSDRTGEATLYLSPDASSENSLLDLEFQYNGQERLKVNVRTVTLDSFFSDQVSDTNVDFMKIDIEGSEYQAFKGMKKIIEKNPHLNLLLEFWPNGFRKNKQDPFGFLRTVADLGFTIHFIDSSNEEIRQVSVKDLEKVEEARTKDPTLQNKVMQVWGWYTNLLCTRKPE